MSHPRGEVHAQWEALQLGQALRQVLSAFRDSNASLFGGHLRTPQIKWSESSSFWGVWRSQERLLELSLRLLERPWGDLLEVLKHEMAHQYVDEVLGVGASEGPHGPSFQKVCAERGIDARTAGDPEASAFPGGRESTQDDLLRRVEHLFSLAQSDNPHEAEAAMKAARRLMLKYNLEAAVSSARSGYSYRHLGRPTGRRMAWQRVLGSILADYFFVEVIIVPVYRPREAKKGTVIEACGTPENLEIASYVHDFLETNALALWKLQPPTGSAAQRGGRIGGTRGSGSAEKNSFLYGVMKGFSDKLEAERKRSDREGLVYVGDPALYGYLRSRHPHIRSVSGQGRVSQDAFSAGHAAGRRLVLHRGVGQAQSGGPVRLLGTGGQS